MIRITAAKFTNKTAQRVGLLFVNDKKFILIKSRKGVNKLMIASKILTGALVGISALGIGGVSVANATSTTPTGTISVDPNPCVIPMGATTCSSNISYKITGAGTFDVCISPNGATEQIFAHVFAGDHTKNAPWVSDLPYSARLRVASDQGYCKGNLLDTVEFTGVKAQVNSESTGTGGQDQKQDQNQNQTQNNNQETNVNVSNVNNNQNNVTINGVLGAKPEVANSETPKQSPETGASAAATAVMLGGMPVGFWLRKFGNVALNA